MARELSQEALLDFLCRAGGRVTNAALLGHFGGFLRDPRAAPAQHRRRRELFKGFVNAVAAVRRDPDGTTCVVLKRRYRDLLGGEQPAGAPGPGGGGLCAREAARGGGADAPARVGARCAAAGTHGRCCWECLQNGLGGPPGEPLPPDPDPDPDPAAPGERGAAAAPGERGVPGREQGCAPAAPLSPPATVGAPPPALLPSAPAPGHRRELMAPGDLHQPRQQRQRQRQRQERTREWVARHPRAPEARDRGPSRAWSVLPESFPLELGLGVPEPNSAPPDPPVGPHAPRPGVPPVAVFRSIRSQLSLHELEDFVDQNSPSSEESSGGPRESSGGSEEELCAALGAPGWRKVGNPPGGPSPKAGDCRRSPRGLRNRGAGQAPPQVQVPPGANGVAGPPPEPLPWPAPRVRRSLRMSSRAGRAPLSSSDEECLEEDLLIRSRRPPRPRKPSKAGAAASPRVDAALTPLTPNPADGKAAVAARGRLHSVGAPGRQAPAALVPHRPEHKPGLVPLDAREHEWMVKLATGSWIRVLALFWEEPQLALHKDFLTGYTALHWIAKHGHLRALQDFVGSAQKAGVALDVNAKSSGGYTPLHLAAIHGHQGVMKLLVERLASRVNVRDSSGKKPWQYLTRNTSGEIWQLLGGPRGKPIFPVFPLVRSSSPTRKAKSWEISRHITRKTSLAALLKSQHSKWKLANQYEKFPAFKEREEDSE